MAAVVIGGMLASAVIKETTRKLGSAIGGEIKLQWNFKRDLEELKDTLESIEAVLEDADRRSIKEKTVQLWLKRLKNASYDISDMLEEFEAKTTRVARKPLVKIFRLTKITKITMVHKMKKMKGKLKNITDQYQNFGFKQGSSSSEQQVPDKRETSSKEEEEFILGRTEEKQTFISSCLYDNINKKIIIIPIYGIGGIGKTTFAKMVFNDTQFKDYCQVWIYVSQTFDLNKIGNSIISELSKEESKLTTRQMIHTSLGKPLTDKKILIVLDDLWEIDQFELDKLKAMLNVGNARKVIVIVTTRDKEIAYKICTIEPYELPPLTDDMCWTIIKQKVDFEARPNSDQLELVGRNIALKCGGVALAAQALGYVLRSMTSDKWVSVRDSDIWNISISGDKSNQHHNVISSLMLSYSTLPPYLKLCFAYCATFSKGHKIVKDDLIYQWISLGFVEPPSIFTAWQHGENYVSHLIGMCFLQYSRSPSTVRVHCENATLLTMHDLLHDLARYVMVDELLDASKQGDTRGARCRFALLNDCTESLRLFTNSPTNIRALRYLKSDKNVLHGASSSSTKYLQFLVYGKTGFHDDIFSSAKYLRVLDLSECVIQELPDSIGQLKQLRYLNAPGIQDRKIPSSITKLSKLIYLNLRGSSAILALPESIGEMEGLNHLDLSACSKIKVMPESIGDLKKLVYLDLSNCSSVTCVSESLANLTKLRYLNLSYCTKIGELPLALGNLTELEYLNLSCSSYLVGSLETDFLGTLTKLEYLNLSSEYSCIERLPEAFGSFIQLKYLNLSGCKTLKELPESFGKLRNLVHLDLSGCFQANGVPEALCSLTMLHYLNLSHCFIYPEAQQYLGGLPNMIGKLLELRYLNLSGFFSRMFRETFGEITDQVLGSISSLSNLEHLELSDSALSSIPDSFSSLRKLHTLDLSGCWYIRRLPESMSDMNSLKFLILDRCWYLDMSTVRLHKSSISLPKFVVQAGEDEQSSNLVLLEDVNSPELEISCLENVKSVEEAQTIKLLEKLSLVKLTLKWTREKMGFLEDSEVLRELMPPSSLTEFRLQDYNNMSFPTWIMDMNTYLPNLVTVKLVGLPQCINLPPLGQLRNLKIVSLETMPSITKIDKNFCGGAKAFPRLEEFYLFDMESLEEWSTTYSDCEDVADEFMFPNLEYLEISCCRKLSLKPCPPRVEVAWRITDSDGVLSQWGESSFTPASLLTFLKVTSCKAPMHCWRLLHHLTALNELIIEDCNDLSISPEIFQTLCSLQSITIEGNNLGEMPEWLGELTSLKKMAIHNYYSVLEELQEVRCTSLQSLKLYGCQRMTSLPQWFRVLTSLRKLEIVGSKNLSNLEETIRHLRSLESLEFSNCGSIGALPEELGDLTSLKELRIMFSEGIMSLPESIQQLTNLQRLTIRWCPALAQWCNSENRAKIAHIKDKRISRTW